MYIERKERYFYLLQNTLHANSLSSAADIVQPYINTILKHNKRLSIGLQT